MQICCALESEHFFLIILQRMAIMAVLSSITPFLNSQTSNKHFELTREIFTNNIFSAVDSWRPCVHTRGKSIVGYLGMLRNYWKTLPSTKIGKTNSPSKSTATQSKGYPIYLVKKDPVNIVISTSYRLLTCANRTTARNELRHFALKWDFFYALLTSKGGNIAFPPIPSMQCWADGWATYRKQQTPQLWMEGTGEGCGFFCSLKLPYLSTMSQQFCRRL